MIVCILSLNIAKEPQKCGVDIAESVSSWMFVPCLYCRYLSSAHISKLRKNLILCVVIMLCWCGLDFRTVFNVDPRTHGTNLESSEQVVLDGTSKWSCKIQVTGTVLSLLLSLFVWRRQWVVRDLYYKFVRVPLIFWPQVSWNVRHRN